MSRSIVLGVLLAAGTLSAASAAYQSARQAKVVEVEKLKDNLYLLKGGGGNTAAFITRRRRRGRRHQEPGLGTAASRQDQGDHRTSR